MQVTVMISLQAARALRGLGGSSPEAKVLLKELKSLGFPLQAVHKDVADPTLQVFYTVEVPDAGAAQRVVDRLLRMKAAEAAYVKPQDEPP